MNNFLHALTVFFCLLPGTYLNAQIDDVSFNNETDDLASYLITFRSYYYSGTGSSVYFSMDDTLRYSFEWDFGNGETGIYPVVMNRYALAGIYEVSLTVTDLTDPSMVFTERIQVTVDDSFEVPNVFTPDGDGINDQFVIRSNGVTPLTITIFDRGGSIVYRHSSPLINWDGRTAGGTRVKPGVYYYIITSSEPLYNKNGFIHIFYGR
jgi:gliding motility-associated-like protein